eukprot:Sro94_g049110.2  (446) ;mRNA; r:107224-108561
MNTTVWQIVKVGGNDSSSSLYEYQPVGNILPGIWSIDDDGINGSLLQSSSISGHGTVVAIGSPNGDRFSPSYRFGHVQVYRLGQQQDNTKRWMPLGSVLLAARDFADLPYLGTAEFGRSTSLSFDGTRMAVGVTEVNRFDVSLSGPPFWNVTEETPVATFSYVQVLQYGSSSDDDNDNNSTTTTPSNKWTPLGDIINGTCIYALDDGCFPCASEDGRFGESTFGQTVSLNPDGTRVAVGAPQHTHHCDERAIGFVRVFELLDDNSWNQVGNDIVVPELMQFDKALVTRDFGRSISLSGNGQLVAIGSNAGAVVMGLQQEQGEWTRVGGILNWSNETFSHNRYTTVSLSTDGSRVAVGGQFGNKGKGAAIVYRWNAESNHWEFDGLPIYYDDSYFGRVMRLSGNDARLCVANEWWSWVFNSPTSGAKAQHPLALSFVVGLVLFVLV